MRWSVTVHQKSKTKRSSAVGHCMQGLYCNTDQDGSIDLMSICFDLGIGNRVVIQHSLEVGPVGRKMWEEHSLNSLPTERGLCSRN